MASNKTAVPAGSNAASLFGVPGFTRPTEHREVNDQTSITFAQSAQKPVTGLQAFRQTDIIVGWRMEVNITPAYAVGTGSQSITSSFPFVYFGPTQLKYQNQFATVDVQSGYDLAIFQLYRPFYNTDSGRNLLDTSPATPPYSAEANLVSASNYTAASTTTKFVVDFPAAVFMHRYWNLDFDGNVVGAPVRGYISPQYMAGTSRLVTPLITMNPLIGNQDGSPVYNFGTQTTPGTGSATAVLGFERIGWYQTRGVEDSPILYNWQYVRKSYQVSVSGRSQATLPIQFYGQILSVWVRLFDPSATVNAVAVGAPIVINTTNITKCQLQYGSGLYRFDDNAVSMQERYARQHNQLPPEGHIIWDLLMTPSGDLENGDNVLNTMTTAGVQIFLQLGITLSATAYAVIGVEGLQYVEPA